MVDLSTAMTAAQGERRQRAPGDGKEKKVRRTGRNLGIEPFDPVKHVAKEKADMASMWLVLGFALLVTLLMRYVSDGRNRSRELKNPVHSPFDMYLPYSDSSSNSYARTLC